jgi:hypothetical protein
MRAINTLSEEANRMNKGLNQLYMDIENIN